MNSLLREVPAESSRPSAVDPPGLAAPRGHRSIAAFIELGKLNVFDLWLGILVAWTLLSREQAFESRTLALIVLVLIVKAASSSAALALDDVAGMRDGLDVKNHGDSDRYAVSKPLMDGRLEERQALRFAYVAICIGLAAMAAAFAVAWPVPLWLVIFEAAVFAVALNYSWWLKLSYRGGGELITLTAVGSTLLVPYSLVARDLRATALIQASLVGLWMLQIAVFSNTQDREGDRQARRWTVAAMTSERGNRLFILGVFAASASLLAGGVWAGRLSFWLFPALVPALVLQAAQIRLGVVEGRWLTARLTGFRAFRLAVAALVLINVLASMRVVD